MKQDFYGFLKANRAKIVVHDTNDLIEEPIYSDIEDVIKFHYVTYKDLNLIRLMKQYLFETDTTNEEFIEMLTTPELTQYADVLDELAKNNFPIDALRRENAISVASILEYARRNNDPTKHIVSNERFPDSKKEIEKKVDREYKKALTEYRQMRKEEQQAAKTLI